MERKSKPKDILSVIVDKFVNEDFKKRGRRRFSLPRFVTAAGLSVLIAYGGIGISRSSSDSVKAFEVLAHSSAYPLPPVALPPNPHDYCKPVTKDSSPGDQSLAGTPQPTQRVIDAAPTPGTLVESESRKPQEEPEEFSVDKSNIVNKMGVTPDSRDVEALLIPVGFTKEELNSRMTKLADSLDSIFKGDGVNIRFSRLNVAAPLDPVHTQQHIKLTESDIPKVNDVLEKVHRAASVHIPIFVVKSTKGLGTAYRHGDQDSKYILVTDDGFDDQARVAHEVGHLLGLSDGYKSNSFAGSISNESLFISIEDLPAAAQMAFAEVSPEIIPTGGVCTRKGIQYAVYTSHEHPDNSVNAMKVNVLPSDAVVVQERQQGRNIFNPTQKNIMNRKAAMILEASP